MAWLSGWDKRVKFTIDQNDIDAALVNFPVLVYLSTSSGRNGDDVSFVFDELENDANRKKIAVTTSDGETECYVEIEKWDDGNEEAWLWVKVPGVASDADTDLYLYYDIGHADNTAYVGDPSDAVVHNVWDSNFKFVSHMQDDPDNTAIRDSTVNANDGTKKGANEPIEADGQISKGQDFDGNDEISANGIVGDVQTTTVGTIELCLKPTGVVGFHHTFAIADGSEVTAIRFGQFDDRVQAAARINGTWKWRILTPTASLSAGTLARIALVHDGTAPKIYVNGVNQALSWDVETDKTVWFNDDPDFDRADIGVIYWNGAFAEYFDGVIDEVRVSVTDRSAAWIKASAESQEDDLLDFGSEAISVTITPSTLALALTLQTPTVYPIITVTPATLELILTQHAPTITTAVVVTPATLELVLTQHAPSLSFDMTIFPSTLELALTLHAPAIPYDVTVLVETLQLALALWTPEVSMRSVEIPPFMLKDLIDPYSGGAWLWLYEISVSGYATQRAVRNTEGIVYGGVLFPKGNFKLGRQSLAGDASIPYIILQVAQDREKVLEKIVNATKGCANGTAKIIRVCEKFFDTSVDALEAEYSILTAGSDFQWVTFVLGIPNPLVQRIPLWLYSSKVCPLATPSLFKGPRCRYAGPDTVCTGLFEDCYLKGNAAHWGAEIGLDPNAVRI